MIGTNKGVTSMLPKKVDKKKSLYDFSVGFVLFKKEFSLSFNVKSKKE